MPIMAYKVAKIGKRARGGHGGPKPQPATITTPAHYGPAAPTILAATMEWPQPTG